MALSQSVSASIKQHAAQTEVFTMTLSQGRATLYNTPENALITLWEVCLPGIFLK